MIYSVSIGKTHRDRNVSPDISLSDHRHAYFPLTADKSDLIKYRNPRVNDWVIDREDLWRVFAIMHGRIISIDELEFAEYMVRMAIHKSHEDNCHLRIRKLGHNASWWNRRLQALKNKLEDYLIERGKLQT